jgi:hypothetical protein
MYDDLRIKALVDGLDANFKDILELDEFVDVIKELIKENPYSECDATGDCDGLLVSDHNDEAVLTVVFNLEKIKFHSLIDSLDMLSYQAEIVARTVLAVIGGLLVWYGDDYLETDPRDLKKLTKEERQFPKPVKSVKPGDTFKYEFENDGFGLY